MAQHKPRKHHGQTFTLIVEDEHQRIIEVKKTPLDKLDAVLKKLDDKLR